MDEAIGNITTKLEELGYMDNMLLVFTSDVSRPQSVSQSVCLSVSQSVSQSKCSSSSPLTQAVFNLTVSQSVCSSSSPLT